MKDKKRDATWVLCRTGSHMVRPGAIAVLYEPGIGLCRACIAQRCRRISEYWTKGRSADAAVDASGSASGARV